MRTLTVSQLLQYLERMVTADPILNTVLVEGEIVNLYRGRFNYFDLKDAKALVHCVDFSRALPANVKDGDQVLLAGRSVVYQERGTFQIRVVKVRPLGKGDALERLEKLKKKLLAEGLFDASRKKALPLFPKRIGLITSASGAVLHDFANEIYHRYPLVEIVLSPSQVQGKTAGQEMVEAMIRLENFHLKKPLDVIVIARGGGSTEDLDAFNDEGLVRKVAASEIPVVSAVGHQVDNTLLDLVSDKRASTPTEAAVLVSPKADDLHQTIDGRLRSGLYAVKHHLAKKESLLLQRMNRIASLGPEMRLSRQIQLLDKSLFHLQELWQAYLLKKANLVDAKLRQLFKVREEQLKKTSWFVEDQAGHGLLAGALEVGESYFLRSGLYRYRIRIEDKEKESD